MSLLISKADFAGYIDLPETLEESRLNPHILAAQRVALEPVLGRALLSDLLLAYLASQVEGASVLLSKWSNLRAACVPFLVYASWEQYLPMSVTTVVASSLVKKKSDQSETLSNGDIDRLIAQARSLSLAYESDLRLFLRTNYSTYYTESITTCAPASPASGRTVQAIG